MRRKLTIVALAAMLLAAGGPALAQSPNIQLQVQPRILIQPRIQQKLKIQPRISKPPTTVRIKPSQALMIAQRMVPNSRAVGVLLLPGGNYAVTLKSNNRVQRVIIDGDTGTPR